MPLDLDRTVEGAPRRATAGRRPVPCSGAVVTMGAAAVFIGAREEDVPELR